MMPAIVPVPISRIATTDIFCSPYAILGRMFFHCFMQIAPHKPPTGKAIKGSILIPAAGRNANKTIVTTGAIRLVLNEGRFLSSSLSASLFFCFSLFEASDGQ